MTQFRLPRRTILQAALALPLLGLVGCKANNSEYRFRLTVEVDTPDGLKSGSSVIEAWAANDFPGSQRRLWGVSGEAVAVDLPQDQTLFALLKTNAQYGDMLGLSMLALDPTFTEHYDVVGTAARLRAREGIRSPAVVDPETYPMLVTFGDIDDPTSVQLVDPDDLAATFGEGYALKRITVEITDDPVTRGIEERLPPPPFGLNREIDGNRVVEALHIENFTTGTK